MAEQTGPDLKGYEVVERIGAGGFGAVYRAKQTTIGREVAIKMIQPSLANKPDFIRRFETEAQIVARLEHPFITPLFDYWRGPEGAYLVMRYLRGGSLRTALDNGPFDLIETSRILDQIASALDFAHRHNVIHRDIKPGNILLDEEGNAYLADFGIAKDLGDLRGGLTNADAVIGSLDYISPEQARGEAVTPRTDIYSLGVMLYELITGQHPFHKSSSVERMYKHINDPLPDIEDLPDHLKDVVNGIVQRATEKDPYYRYADVMALALAFREAVGRGDPNGDLKLLEQLTLREHEILQYIIDGRSNKEIADTFVIAVTTVKWHVRQIYRKLGVRSRVQAIVRAREMNLIGSIDTDEMSRPVTDAAVLDLSMPEPENPYKGLRAFQTGDERDFFGRKALVEKLIDYMREDRAFKRFMAIVGPSGSGKSSVVKAGIIPALWRGALPGSQKWFVVEMLPGTRPMDELEVALIRVAANQVGNLREQLQRDEFGLVRVADLILPHDDTELVLIIDQFEELFTMAEREDERRQFLDLLRASTTDKRSRVRIIVTLRADYYDRPLHYPEFGEMLRSSMETIMPLGARDLELAIRGPAERVGVSFEPGLVAQIVSQMTYQPAALPLLQYALTELFERREGRLLTTRAYNDMGGAVGALAHRSDEIFQSFSTEDQDLTRQMFLRLVTLGEGSEDTRRRAPMSELLSLTDKPDLMEDIIDAFADYRLLTLDNHPETRSPTVEVSHEAILREWERLRGWLNESRDDIRQQRVLNQAAQDWKNSGQDKSYLLSGSRLEQAQTSRAMSHLTLTPLESSFINASEAEAKALALAEDMRRSREVAQEKRSQGLLRSLVGVFALATLLSGSLGIFAFDQRNESLDALAVAERNEEIALENADIARRSSLAFAANAAQQEGRTDLALALAFESVDDDESELLPESAAILETLSNSAGPVIEVMPDGWCLPSLSPDAKASVFISCDFSQWASFDVTGGEIMATAPMPPQVANSNLIFRQDHEYFMTSEFLVPGAPIEIWKTSDLSLAHSISFDLVVGEMRWLDDDTIIVLDLRPEELEKANQGMPASFNTFSLWDVNSSEMIRRIEFDDTFNASMAVSHDGRMAAVGGFTSADEDAPYQATILDIETGENLYRFERRDTTSDGRYNMLKFSFDDRLLFFHANKGYIVEIATGENYSNLHELDHGLAGVRDIDETMTYALVQTDEGLRRYNLLTGDSEVYTMGGLESIGDKGWFRSINTNNTGEIWDNRGRQDLIPDSIEDLQYAFPVTRFSPDGQWLAVTNGYLGAADNGYTVVYDADMLEEAFRLPGSNNSIFDLTWSPDARYLAVITTPDEGPGAIVLYDGQNGTELRRLSAPDVPFYTMTEFTPDSRYLVSGRHSRFMQSEGTPSLLMWDVETGELVKEIALGEASDEINFGVHWLQMHPSRNLVYVSVNYDFRTTGLLRPVTDYHFDMLMVDLDSGEIREMERDFIPYGVVFTPDGSRMIFSSFLDNLIRVYDTETLAMIDTWVSSQEGTAFIAITSDGRYALTNSNFRALSKHIALWDVETGKEIRKFPFGNQSTYLISVDIRPDNQRFVTTSAFGSIDVWQLDTRSPLEWLRENRLIRDFTCIERSIYRIQPLCDEQEG